MKSAFAFQFIAGKYEGGVYLIPDDRDLMVGRGAELDIVLVEDMVSRRHASLTSHAGRLVLTDLGSTNGTYVNGERIDTCALEAQDRVLIGTSILRVTPADQIDTLLQTHPHLDLSSTPQPQRTEGNLVDVPIGDLLRLFSSNRRTGLLRLLSQGQDAELVFVDGGLTHASIKDRPALSPMACLVEALGFADGQFAFEEPAEGFERPDSFSSRAEDTIKRAVSERAQIEVLVNNGWPASAKIVLVQPQPGPWSAADFDGTLLDSLQLGLTFGHVEQILRHTTRGALKTLQALSALEKQGYVRRER